MNPFEFNPNDVTDLFALGGEKVLVEGVPTKAFITGGSSLSRNIVEDRKLHTVDLVPTGSQITYRNNPYLVVAENKSKQHAKSVAFMRHCNHTFRFQGDIIDEEWIGYDDRGRPIFETVYEEHEIHAVVTDTTFAVDDSTALKLATGQITVIVKDDEVTRENLTPNTIFDAVNERWKVETREFTHPGLIIISASTTAS